MKAIMRGSSGRLGSGSLPAVAPELPAEAAASTDSEAPVPQTMTFPDGTPVDPQKVDDVMQQRLGDYEAETLPCYSYQPKRLCRRPTLVAAHVMCSPCAAPWWPRGRDRPS